MQLDPITVKLMALRVVKTRRPVQSRTYMIGECEKKNRSRALLEFSKPLLGDHSEVVPLLPIPNRTVKHLSADDSWLYFQ